MAKWRRRVCEQEQTEREKALRYARSIIGYRVRLGSPDAYRVFLKLRPEATNADLHEVLDLVDSLVEEEIREIVRALDGSAPAGQILYALEHGAPY